MFTKKNGYELSPLYKSGNNVRTPSGYLFRWSKMKTGSLVHQISKIQRCHISKIILPPDARLTQNENDNTTVLQLPYCVGWSCRCTKFNRSFYFEQYTLMSWNRQMRDWKLSGKWWQTFLMKTEVNSSDLLQEGRGYRARSILAPIRRKFLLEHINCTKEMHYIFRVLQ